MEKREPRILVAVQEMFFVVKIAAAAKRVGVNVELVQDEKELLKKTEFSPSVVIVDLHNSGLNPIELVQKLKASPPEREADKEAGREIQIIAYLSHVQRDLKREAELAGCDVLLPRSVFSQNLEELLRQHSCHL